MGRITFVSRCYPWVRNIPPTNLRSKNSEGPRIDTRPSFRSTSTTCTTRLVRIPVHRVSRHLSLVVIQSGIFGGTESGYLFIGPVTIQQSIGFFFFFFFKEGTLTTRWVIATDFKIVSRKCSETCGNSQFVSLSRSLGLYLSICGINFLISRLLEPSHPYRKEEEVWWLDRVRSHIESF